MKFPLGEDFGIQLQYGGIEAHNSIVQVEIYHHPLRRVFNIIRTSQKSLGNTTTLRIAIKAINDTMGPNGLIPSLLVPSHAQFLNRILD